MFFSLYIQIYLTDDGGCVLEGTETPFPTINSLIENYRYVNYLLKLGNKTCGWLAGWFSDWLVGLLQFNGLIYNYNNCYPITDTCQ